MAAIIIIEREFINMTQKKQMTNPLGTDRISTLVARFAVPSIIAMLVSAVYNIADQLFIGNAVGTLGNAATNIAFPLSMLCTSLALLFGIGGAASFNLHMGAGRKEEAPYYIGNSITMLLSLGFLLLLITELFLNPLLVLFGSPADVLPLAEQYVRVTAVGFPFLILTIGSGHLIRADGSPKMAMFVTVSGAVINIVLDALFVFGFQWGMYGAAWATVIGQIISAVIAIRYLMHYRTVTLEKQHFIPSGKVLAQICSLGMSSGINQIAMMIVQIVMNNLLKHYGAQSVYGESIPIALSNQKLAVPLLQNVFPLVRMPLLAEVPLDKEIEADEYRKELKELQNRLGELHNRLYRKKVPVIIAYEGWDAAGKGGNIKRIAGALDPRGYEVHPIASPEPHEKARHYLWRFWTRLPKTGHIAIFDRTWYGRVMVERLEEFCSENDWMRAYNEINEFEKELHDWGAVIIKFWVQIDKDTQLERFNERQNTPEKQWKITDEDWRNRDKWDAYETAVNEMIQKTSTTYAPWHILESVDKKYARIKALKIVVEELEKVLG
jgi:polyphosphate kinase 2 (PPK2 family)